MKKEIIDSNFMLEIAWRFYWIKKCIEDIVETTKKEHSFWASSLDVDYICEHLASWYEIHFKSWYKIHISLSKLTRWRALYMKSPNIIYPETIEVLKDISNKILNYNKERTTFNDYEFTKLA